MSRAAFNVENPAEILQQLIRFDTTNPPGNEAECILYIRDMLASCGIETGLVEKKTGRPNLVARLKGSGNAPPFLMYGHADVVTTANQHWTYPPFEGRISDGCIWGRGALDMKGSLVMMIAALMKIKSCGTTLPGDIILAVVCDEEEEGEFGAEFLVEEHPELFQNVSFAIGEFGGFTLHLADQRFYPIMIAEKQKCTLRCFIKGPGGHGSIPIRDGAMAKVAVLLNKLNTHPLPVHVTPPVKMMINGLTAGMPFPANFLLNQLANPVLTDAMIKLLGERGRFFEPLLHNTVNPTIIHGGHKINVVPSEIEVCFDGRLLPGFGPTDLLKELESLLGRDFDFEVTNFISGPGTLKMDLFDLLAKLLKEADPGAIPVPFVISAVTDARYFARLGIQTYGFTPMIVPNGFDFTALIHSADERIPIAALEFGTRAITTLLQQLGSHL